MGRLSSKGESGEGVHDQVNPKHLRRGERGLREDASTSENNEHGDDVDGQLELEELADVIVNVAAIPDGSQDGAEVVIKKLNVASTLGDISTGNAHGEADISAVESGGVVGAITSNGNGRAGTDQTINEHELVIRH